MFENNFSVEEPENLSKEEHYSKKGLSGLAFIRIHLETILDVDGVIDKFAEDNICLKFALCVF